MDERTHPAEQPVVPEDELEEQPLPLDPTGEGKRSDDPVEDASEDSFPASDPPSFTRTTTE
jgi:hypothetical protein